MDCTESNFISSHERRYSNVYPANFVLNRVIQKVILFLHASVASRRFISSQLRSEPCHPESNFISSRERR